MSEEAEKVFGGFNSPTSMAESIGKRYDQFKRALPSSDYKELFKLVLDNRYKLKGNIVSISERNSNIEKSEGSLCLLTLNTILSENDLAGKTLVKNDDLLKAVLAEICHAIGAACRDYSDLSTMEIFEKAKVLVKGN